MSEENYSYLLKLADWRSLLIKKIEGRIEHILTSDVYPSVTELEAVRLWLEWLEDDE
jgi:hypothetical protein